MEQQHWTDAEDNPAGGYAVSLGLTAVFQNGPVKLNGVNGCQVDDLLTVAVGRLDFLQNAGNGRFRCEENDRAISYISSAILALSSRTARREKAGIEGYNKEE